MNFLKINTNLKIVHKTANLNLEKLISFDFNGIETYVAMDYNEVETLIEAES